MDTLRLDSLPVEILCRILTQGPCSNALALSQVNHAIRSICIDPRLYGEIVRHQNGESRVVSDPTWWANTNLDAESDWQICARWAFADMKAVQNVCRGLEEIEQAAAHHWPGTGDRLKKLGAELLDFVPELVSRGHKAAIKICRDGVIWEADWLQIDVSQPDSIARGAFYNTCERLAKEPAESFPTIRPGIEVTYTEMYEFFSENLSRAIQTYMPELIPEPNVWQWKDIVLLSPGRATWNAGNLDPNNHQTRRLVLGTTMTNALYLTLAEAIENNRIQRSLPNKPNLNPPMVQNIPFDRLYTTKHAPFGNPMVIGPRLNRSDHFITRHLPKMTSADFLTRGEWVGYYNYTSLNGGSPTWDTMMHGVRFGVGGDYADHCLVTSRGDDGCGHFMLYGTVYKQSGWVQMYKQYDNGTLWPWSAVMTPFGIVGCWGGRWGGWVWLWKRSWSSPR